MDIGQGHTRDSHSVATKYISQRLIKRKRTRLLTFDLGMIKHTSCVVDGTRFQKWNTGLVILHEQPPAFQQAVCPWARGA